MTTSTRRAVPRPLSVGAASLGLLALAGCAVGSATADNSPPSGDTASTGYTDGTYTVDAGYQAPSGRESIQVTLTVAGDAVTAVTVTGDATDREAREYQNRFASAIGSEAVGRNLSGLTVSRVAGASLTSNAFDAALDDIRSQAS